MGHLSFDALDYKHFICQCLRLFLSSAMERTSTPHSYPRKAGWIFGTFVAVKLLTYLKDNNHYFYFHG